jgi:phage terminase small subunit
LLEQQRPKGSNPRKASMPRATEPTAKAGTSKAADTARKRAFAEAYIANKRNGRLAAIAAGLSEKGAEIAAVRILKDPGVVALIAELTAAHEQSLGLKTDATLRETDRLIRSDLRTLIGPNCTVKDPSEWDDEMAAAVASFEVVEEFSGTGEDRKLTGYVKKIKLWDKNAAIDKGMRHLGLYEKDNAQHGESLMIKIELVE